MSLSPPRLAERLLVRMFRHDRPIRSQDFSIHDRIAETVAGDFAEVYASIAEDEGQLRASMWYWRQVIQSTPVFIMFTIQRFLSMIRSYSIAAMRHFKRTRWYTLSNVAGLGIGLSVAIIAFLFARHEMGFDRFHPDADRLYRVGMAAVFEELTVFESTPFPLADELAATLGSIEQTARYSALASLNVKAGSAWIESDVHAVSDGFFDLFAFPVGLGQGPEALAEPGSMMLTTSARERLFGEDNPIGQSVLVELQPGQETEFIVAGVLAPPDGPTMLQFDILIPERHLVEMMGGDFATSWMPKSRTVTFAKLQEGVDPASLRDALNDLSRTYGLDAWVEGLEDVTLLPMEPLVEAHLSETFPARILGAQGDASYVQLLVAIALLMLAVAAINFINLSVGLSARRAREVGVRKVFGASRHQLTRQYLFEHVLLTVAALAVALVAAWFILPIFNSVAGSELKLSDLLSPGPIILLLSFSLFTGIISGAYPALLLSGVRPIQALRPLFKLSSGRSLPRLMIGFQFIISMFLIGATVVVTQQIHLVAQRDLGFTAEQVLVQNLPRAVDSSVVAEYRTRLSTSRHILGVSGSRVTLLGDAFDSALRVEMNDNPYTLAAGKIDDHFLDVMDIQLVEGRNLDQPGDLDSPLNVVVNEAFVEGFGIDNPIGAPTPFAMSREGYGTIVGVVQDFHFQSLRRTIEPYILYGRPESGVRQILVRIDGSDISAAMVDMQEAWEETGSGILFEVDFLDDTIAAQYALESRMQLLGSTAAVLAILIAIMGLLGMTALSIARRTREIGIRKCMGATKWSIISLFGAELMPVAIVSAMIASALTWWSMNWWLDGYAFRIDVSPFVLAASSLIVFLLAATILSMQSLKAADQNPVDVLRHE